MARNILILGYSYGSLLATKLLMAGHNVTLVSHASPLLVRVHALMPPQITVFRNRHRMCT